MKHLLPLILLSMAGLVFSGCQTAYYNSMAMLGKEKRDILTDRVEKAKDSQEDAKETFVDALEAYRTVVSFDGGDLEAQYRDLKAVQERAQGRADAVSSRISAIEKVANDLFAEWEQELSLYTSDRLRSASELKLRQTMSEYDAMMRAMNRARASMDPVLATLSDQVLYLKHNLNARAISSLRNELRTVEQDVAGLIREMERAISQAEQFITKFTADY